MISKAAGAPVEFTEFDWSADRYLRDGVTIPADGFAMLARDFDAIFVGALGDPRVPSNIHAKEILLTGKPFNVQQAFEWGMVNHVCEPEELMPAALATARQMCGSAPVSLRQAKTAIRRGLDVDLRTGLAIEIEAYNRTVVTEDRLEGVRAFGEKRKP